MVLAFGFVKRIRSSMRLNKNKGSTTNNNSNNNNNHANKKKHSADNGDDGSAATASAATITERMENGNGPHHRANDKSSVMKNGAKRNTLVVCEDSEDDATTSTSASEAWIFLNYQGQTKRALLSYDDVRNVEDLRSLFRRMFQYEDGFDPAYLHNPNVKVYAQDPNRPDVFYQLESIKDIKPKTLLKLHEQAKPAFIQPGALTTITATATTTTNQNSAGRFSTTNQQRANNRSSPTSSNNSNSGGGGGMNNQQYSSYHSEPETETGMFCKMPKFPTGHVTDNNSTPYKNNILINQRHYGTLDSYYRHNNNAERSRLNSNPEPPAKPQRYKFAVAGGTLSPTRQICVDFDRTPRPNVRAEMFKTNSESDKDSGSVSSNPIGRLGAGAGMSGYHGYRDLDHVIGGSSDRSSNTSTSSRSGSVTPIVDEEARARMLNMEKHLANLSALVHSALMTNKGGAGAGGVNETVYKDLELLRREILGPPSNRDDSSDAGSISRFSDLSSDKGSYTVGGTADSFYNTDFVSPHQRPAMDPATRQALKNLKKRTNEINVELKCLRRMVQVNAQTARDVLKDAFDRIRVILNTNQHLHIFAAQAQHQNLMVDQPSSLLSDRSWINQEEEKHKQMLISIEQDLSTFEKQVEEIREKVVNGRKKLKISEVEQFTEILTNIIRAAANLKTQFPQLQERLKQVMSCEMEKVVREEKFLKDEPHKLDSALKRCKKLTGTIITMKKLAMVQDPAGSHSGQNSQLNSPTSEEAKTTLKFTSESTNRTPVNHHHYNTGLLKTSANVPAPVLKHTPSLDDSYSAPGPNNNYSSAKPNNTNNFSSNASNCSSSDKSSPEPGQVLDCLLEELTNVANSTTSGRSTTMAMEKRVGFADQSTGGSADAGSTDTIKRSPKSAGPPQQPLASPSFNTMTYSTGGGMTHTGGNTAAAVTADFAKTGLKVISADNSVIRGNTAPYNGGGGGTGAAAFDENMNITTMMTSSPTNQNATASSLQQKRGAELLPVYAKSYVAPPISNAIGGGGIRPNPLFVENFSAASASANSRSMTNSPKPIAGARSSASATSAAYNDRSRSNTPLSSASEPISFEHAAAQHYASSGTMHFHQSASSGTPSSAPPPPPPLRSSSRLVTSSPYFKNAMLNVSGAPSAGAYPENNSSAARGRSNLAPPAMIQTNAVDIETDYQHQHGGTPNVNASRNSSASTIKSASSNESVNSQDAAFMSQLSPFKKPPPPPPPRNKQEMLEQRQHELMTKQLRYNTYQQQQQQQGSRDFQGSRDHQGSGHVTPTDPKQQQQQRMQMQSPKPNGYVISSSLSRYS